MNKVKLITKVSPTNTTISLKMGIPTSIKNREIKAGNLKSTITRLRKRGYEIEYTEDGRIDDILVTLKKKPL